MDSKKIDAQDAIKEESRNVLKYMAHDMRSVVQEHQIVEIYKDFHGDRTRKKGFILLDFKMKFQLIFYPESSPDFFWEEGDVIAWYGITPYTK